MSDEEMQHILAEREELRQMLALMPKSHIIDRISILARLESIDTTLGEVCQLPQGSSNDLQFREYGRNKEGRNENALSD